MVTAAPLARKYNDAIQNLEADGRIEEAQQLQNRFGAEVYGTLIGTISAFPIGGLLFKLTGAATLAKASIPVALLGTAYLASKMIFRALEHLDGREADWQPANVSDRRAAFEQANDLNGSSNIDSMQDGGRASPRPVFRRAEPSRASDTIHHSPVRANIFRPGP